MWKDTVLIFTETEHELKVDIASTPIMFVHKWKLINKSLTQNLSTLCGVLFIFSVLLSLLEYNNNFS